MIVIIPAALIIQLISDHLDKNAPSPDIVLSKVLALPGVTSRLGKNPKLSFDEYGELTYTPQKSTGKYLYLTYVDRRDVPIEVNWEANPDLKITSVYEHDSWNDSRKLF